MLLEEKQVPYRVEKINMRCYGDKPGAFLAKVPSGMLPVVELDGAVLTESDRIIGALEATFPERPMVPDDGDLREEVGPLLRLERELFSAWMGWLTSSFEARGLRAFEDVLARVALALQRHPSPYFLPEFSIVDVQFAPFLERMEASLLYYKGYRVRDPERWPNIVRWFEGMETRPAYVASKGDYYTHAHDLPPQLGGCVSNADAGPFQAAIDGLEPSAWALPLGPLADSVEPVGGLLAEDPPADRLAAAEALIGNRDAVVQFALRGCGQPGRPPVSAPLSDPRASPAATPRPGVDLALRHVAFHLLSGDGGPIGELECGLEIIPEAGGAPGPTAGSPEPGTTEAAGLAGTPVADSLAYLRDRVGVPRDLPLPAARQLRAHLHHLHGRLLAGG